MRTSQKIARIILLVGILAMALSACGTANQPTEAASNQASGDETITLEYWVYADFAQGQALELQKTFISEFEATHPGVKINIVGKNDADLTTGQIAGAASKTIPDIFMNSVSEGAKLVQAGVMSNIYDKWVAMPEEFRSQFSDKAISQVTPAEGEMWAIPYTGYGALMFRNLKVLRAAGIDPNEPVETWEQWLVQMEKIQAAGYTPIHSFTNDWWDFSNIYAGVSEDSEWGIDFENNKTLMNPDKYTQAMEFMLQTKPYSTPLGIFDQGTTDLFISDKLAFFVTGPWMDPTFKEAQANNGLEYDVVLIPGATPGQTGGITSMEVIGVAPNAHADLAFEFATYLVDEPQMTRWASELGRYNLNQSTMAKLTDDPLLTITDKSVQGAMPKAPPYFTTPYPANYFQVMVDNMAAIMNGDIIPADGAKDLIDQLNQVLAEE